MLWRAMWTFLSFTGGRNRAYGSVNKVLDIPRLEPHLYTEEEYERMKGTLSKMTEGGVVILSKGERG